MQRLQLRQQLRGRALAAVAGDGAQGRLLALARHGHARVCGPTRAPSVSHAGGWPMHLSWQRAFTKKTYGNAHKHTTCSKTGAGRSPAHASLYQAPQPQADSRTLPVSRKQTCKLKACT